MPASLYARFGKRALDFTAALLGLLVLSPLLLAVAAAIKLLDPGEILFRQLRVGLDFRPFSMLKFRTMRPLPRGAGPSITAAGDARITPLGRLLRRSKLDELPQLINVLRGEMSLVGPRPEVPKYVELFKEDYKTVLSVRPGITDYAALAYRDEEKRLSVYPDVEAGYINEVLPSKIVLYRRYVAEMGLLTDLKLLLATLAAIIA